VHELMIRRATDNIGLANGTMLYQDFGIPLALSLTANTSGRQGGHTAQHAMTHVGGAVVYSAEPFSALDFRERDYSSLGRCRGT
jgi:hypothetical protein